MSAPTYPHCHHCCWGHEHHPDDAASHETPCWTGCEGAVPIAQEVLW